MIIIVILIYFNILFYILNQYYWSHNVLRERRLDGVESWREVMPQFEWPQVIEFEGKISPTKKIRWILSIIIFTHCFLDILFKSSFYRMLDFVEDDELPHSSTFFEKHGPGKLDFFKRSDEAIRKVGLLVAESGKKQIRNPGQPIRKHMKTHENTWKLGFVCETFWGPHVDTFWRSFLWNHCKRRLL